MILEPSHGMQLKILIYKYSASQYFCKNLGSKNFLWTKQLKIPSGEIGF